MNYHLIDTDNFVQESVRHLTDAIKESIAKRGTCIIGLSGGSTPIPVYTILGKRTDVDWSKVTMFVLDERYVPHDHTESNQKMMRETLCAGGHISDTQIIAPDTSLSLAACITAYENIIDTLLNNHPADVLVLGIGNDGHITSLFPPLLDTAFGPHSIIHTTTDTLAVHDRISVTLPVLQAANHAFLLFTGEEKRRVWEDMIQSPDDARRWPLKAVMEKVPTTVIAG